MAVGERARTESRHAEDLRSSTDEQIRAFFGASRHVAPIGNLVAGLVATSLLWSHVPHPRLWTWLGVVVVLGGLQARAALDPESAPEELTAPQGLIDTNVLAGVVWGVMPWLDIVSFGEDEVYRWIVLALTFAIGAGAMGGLSILTGIGVRVQVPLYSLVGAAFLVAGSPAVAGGVLVFLVLMVIDMRGTGENLRALIDARVASADRAADAESEARRDALTGLWNRVGAFERMEGYRGGGPFVVMFVDLDHFKEVNDRLGHEAGDAVLVETAHRIKDAMRPDDVVARLGGDEFLVVFDLGSTELGVVSRRVLAEVERPIRVGPEQAAISASIGVTFVDDDDWDTSTLLRQADHALYEAKRKGRQRIVWFDDRLADELDERRNLEAELRQAIDDHAIKTVGQPVFDMATERVCSVELSPRWVLASGKEIAPDVFAPLAERIGLHDALTRSVLDQAGLARRRWRTHPELASATVTVRVGAGRLVPGGLADDVAATIVHHGLEPGELQLLLTDTAAIRDPQRTIEMISSLRDTGVGIALGEFGVGKSTMRDLLQLPIDVVTMHPRLVHDAPEDERLEKLLSALDHVAGSLGLEVAADGVDTPAQLAVVHRLGLPYAQGDALRAPCPLSELEGEVAPTLRA